MMYKEKSFSALAIATLKETLSVIFWRKEDLQDFLKLSIENSLIIGTLNWDGTKREAIKELIERMLNRQDFYKNDLMSLFIATSNFDNFDNLKYWDSDGAKTKKAIASVNKLKGITAGFTHNIKEIEDALKRREQQEKNIQQKKSLAFELATLQTRFNSLVVNPNAQQRGYELEKFLLDLFTLYELEAKGSFVNSGEQIDGAFTFQGNDYLLEAKWKRQVDRGDLAHFCNKVETKFKTAIGLLVTINGLTSEAISPHFKSIIIMDGIDITAVLENRISLKDLLFKKRRKAIETGNIYLNFPQLID